MGVEWNLKRDSFQYKVDLNFSPRKKKQRTGPDIQLIILSDQVQILLTKWMVLSQLKGIYNLLGFTVRFYCESKAIKATLKYWSEQIPWLEWCCFYRLNVRKDASFQRFCFKWKMRNFNGAWDPKEQLVNHFWYFLVMDLKKCMTEVIEKEMRYIFEKNITLLIQKLWNVS